MNAQIQLNHQISIFPNYHNFCASISSNQTWAVVAMWLRRCLNPFLPPPPPKTFVMTGPMKGQRTPGPLVTHVSGNVSYKHVSRNSEALPTHLPLRLYGSLTEFLSRDDPIEHQRECFTKLNRLEAIRHEPGHLFLHQNRLSPN